MINGLKVYAPSQLPELIRRFPDLGMLLALPSVARRRRQEILNELAPYGLHVRSLPDMGDILTGTAQAGEIRELDVNDLLGREAVSPNEGLFPAMRFPPTNAIETKTVAMSVKRSLRRMW